MPLGTDPPSEQPDTEPRTAHDAMVAALYDDRCIEPPPTEHAEHVITSLLRQGFRIEARAKGRALVGSTRADPEPLDVLAEIEHVQWCEWASTLLATEPGISDERRQRWQRLIATPYADLTEAEKNQDRVYAEKVLARLRAAEPE